MTPAIKSTKLSLKHKMWELESEVVQCTYDLMGDVESHSTSEVGHEADPPVINMERSGEITQVYTRRSRTPSPKDSVPRKGSPRVIPAIEKNDNIPLSHETQGVPGELGESKEVGSHEDQEGEEF